MAQIEQHVTESEKEGKSAGGAFPAGEAGEEEQDELFPAGVDVILEPGTGFGLPAPAPAEAGLCPGGPSDGPDGGEGDRGTL